LVAGTATSGPACVTRATSAASASGEAATLVTATVAAPHARAHSWVSTISAVAPDCETETTSESDRSSRER
jgi:hypothetical protein